MRRAHLRRYGALDRRATPRARLSNRRIFVCGAQTWPRTPPARVRLACGHRAPPRSWILLTAIAGFLRQAPRTSPRGRAGSADRRGLAAGADGREVAVA